MSRPKKIPPSTIDFDLKAPSARIHTLGLLLLPSDTSSQERFDAAAAWLRLSYENRMRGLGETLYMAAAEQAEWNAMGRGSFDYSLDDVFAELGVQVDTEQFVAPFSIVRDAYYNYALEEPAGTPPQPEDHLDILVRRNMPSRRLRNTSADLRDFLSANGYDRILLQDAMSPGLTLIVVGCLYQHHGSPSRMMARSFIKAAGLLDDGKSDPRRQTEFLLDWSPPAPLWAGVITAAGCWNDLYLIDERRLERELIRTIAAPDRLYTAYRYAQWFIRDLPTVARAPVPIVDQNAVIRIPDSVVPLEPKLPKLHPSYLTEASKEVEELRAYEARRKAEKRRAKARSRTPSRPRSSI